MKTKVQRDWGVVLGELNERLQQCDRNFGKLSKACGISYFAARRFVLGKAKNRTLTALKLCKYFEIPTEETAKVQGRKLEELTELVASVWDGSNPHAELLTKLIKSTKPFKVQERAK